MPVIRITAAESARDQRRAAAALFALGCTAGDRVAVVAAASRAYLGVVLGALRVGIVPVLLNPAAPAWPTISASTASGGARASGGAARLPR